MTSINIVSQEQTRAPTNHPSEQIFILHQPEHWAIWGWLILVMVNYTLQSLRNSRDPIHPHIIYHKDIYI